MKFNLPGYKIREKISENSKTLLYSAFIDKLNKNVIIKIPSTEYPSNDDIARIQHEYEVLNKLNIKGVVKTHSIEKYQNLTFLVLEAEEVMTLDKKIPTSGMSLEIFFPLAIKLSGIIDGIHKKNIIHKDIKPHNILFSEKTGNVTMINFGLASFLETENSAQKSIHSLEGTQYISPEQTGRMNRTIDYRTDFYSLGISFYEALTGTVPFRGKDPMELVHCHIAKQPFAPCNANPQVPTALSNIVMKLLSKNAEDRYKSASGLKTDLEYCYDEWKKKGAIINFSLGKKDILNKFYIPQKLYGRENQLKILFDGYEKVSKGIKEIMLVTGYSGIGKSALINEIHKPIVRDKGNFIAGKFDQLNRNMPYRAIIQAFTQLINQLLTESEEKLNYWKRRLLEALGHSGQVIIEIIPEIELIIGEQPAVSELSPNEAQNRFNFVFQRFLKVFTRKEHPLVIFLDDLQWADRASLQLIENLFLQSDISYLFFIGAYRDNEVSETHPLNNVLGKIEKDIGNINRISLNPLGLKEVNQLISDTLARGKERTMPLAELVFKKTSGNPFFVNQFLKTLHYENILFMNFQKGEWQWDVDKIHQISFTDNVIELMANKINKLPPEVRETLKIAAVIGSRFDLKTLSIVQEKPIVDAAKSLFPSLQEGLIISESVFNLKELEVNKYSDENQKDLPVLRFLHDRVQQAAYSLINEDHKKELHLKISRLLFAQAPKNEINERIFEIVNHLNQGNELLKNPEEKNKAARLNLIAGKKAKMSSAYEPAFKYFKKGVNLLCGEKWEKHPQLTLNLFLEGAEAACLCKDFNTMESYIETVNSHVTEMLDQVKVYEIKIQSFVNQNKPHEAVMTGLEILKKLGVSIPLKPGKFDIFMALLKTKFALRRKSFEDLKKLPEMSDPYKLASIKILTRIGSPAYLSNQKMIPLIAFKILNLSVKYGNSPASLYAYASYGFFLCAILGDINTGWQFGRLPLELMEKYGTKELFFKTRAVALNNFFVRHYKEHINKTLTPILQSYQMCFETGDFEFLGFCVSVYLSNIFLIGRELGFVEKELTKYYNAFKKMKKERTYFIILLILQIILNLMGKSKNITSLENQNLNEEELLHIFIQANDKTAMCAFYTFKFMLLYFFGDYHQSLENIRKAEKYVESIAGRSTFLKLYYFYSSLTYIGLVLSADKPIQKGYLKKVHSNQKKLKKLAEHAPMNYLHNYYLIEAERLRVLGKNEGAAEKYDEAIHLAHENEYIHEEALANELAAKFFLSRGKEKIACIYMKDAHYYYSRWGASAKTAQLEKIYSNILNKTERLSKIPSPYESSSFSPSSSTRIGDIAEKGLDLISIIKASRSISGEISFGRLLEKLIFVLIENAGAQKGFLIFEREGRLFIEAEGHVEKNEVKVLQSIPLHKENNDEESILPLSIVHYVYRTKKNVVLNEAFRDEQFVKDRYIKKAKPLSIFCMAILHQSKLAGILYLENNLTSGAFTQERVETLQLLSSQAAISLENAELYANLEQKVEERTSELKKALDDFHESQAQLIQSEKMAALGQIVAGLAHEINTPIGAIKSSVENIVQSLKDTLNQLPLLFQTMNNEQTQDFFKLLERSYEARAAFTTREERKIRKAIMKEMEYHGIEDVRHFADIFIKLNIYENIEPYVPLIKSSNADFILSAAYKISSLTFNTKNISIAVNKASKVVFALKSFARYDHSSEKIKARLKDGLETVLTIYSNQIKQNTKLIKNYEDVDEIYCFPDELNQVWTNLIHNSLQAMKNKGTLSIEIKKQGNFQLVSVRDTGCGIPDEIKDKIFNPFFTTKKAGEGSGLGLDIVKKIVDKHNGKIEVESETGKGTTFLVYIPVNES